MSVKALVRLSNRTSMPTCAHTAQDRLERSVAVNVTAAAPKPQALPACGVCPTAVLSIFRPL